MPAVLEPRNVLDRQDFYQEFNDKVETVLVYSTNIEAITLDRLMRQENSPRNKETENCRSNPILEFEKRLEELHRLVLPSYQETLSDQLSIEHGRLREPQRKRALFLESDPGIGYFHAILRGDNYNKILDIKSNDNSVELGQQLKSLFTVLDRIINSLVLLNDKNQTDEAASPDSQVIDVYRVSLQNSFNKLSDTISNIMSVASDRVKQLCDQEIETSGELSNVKRFSRQIISNLQ